MQLPRALRLTTIAASVTTRKLTRGEQVTSSILHRTGLHASNRRMAEPTVLSEPIADAPVSPLVLSEMPAQTATGTVYPILLMLGLCHLLNDMMQSLLPSIYPLLQQNFALDFGQVGLITLTFQITASM